MAGVCRQTLSSLEPQMRNSLVIGIIIHNEAPRSINLRNSRFGTGQSSVWSFTMRDSEIDFINVTVWGSANYINKLFSTFHLGNVVEIINPKVIERRPDDRNEQFVPSVSNPYTLTVNEGVAHIQAHESPKIIFYKNLLRLPTKNVERVQRLCNIIKSIEELEGQYVDILVIVVSIKETRDIITRDKRLTAYRDFEISDGSIDKPINLRLWNKDWIKRSTHWIPTNTILFLADLRITYNQFKKRMELNTAWKTLITENPNIPECVQVRDATRRRLYNVSQELNIISNLDNIKNIMTLKQINELISLKKFTAGTKITTIVYAEIREMEWQCSVCKKAVAEDQNSCSNPDCCGIGGADISSLNSDRFDFKLSLKDGTGYLIGCRLSGIAAERTLNCNVQEFMAMSLADRIELKWRYLVETCKIYLQIVGPSLTSNQPIFDIIAIQRVASDESDHSSNH
ncbi:meiosis-specific with OB domain-containing protein isoform X2 [Cephus cinctus]|uniref:Meiosis-specific with OB domain-containing protein isoform X2 n=1 Tax=Cephus cinctus TaxID=211228 RepID=A0AAJ7C9Y0_CEPCN|nr:meiosis-specific with OB domain-containing protein isoform X2 [Cephus cinctus]